MRTVHRWCTISQIGHRIRRFRKIRAKTQKELSEIIGISRGALESYEAGRNHLNDETLIRFAIALKVSLDELVGINRSNYINDTKTPNVRLVKRMQQIECLPINDQKVIIRTIDTFLKGSSTAKSLPSETP